MGIRCSECKMILSLEDKVVLNQIFSLAHKDCILYAPSFLIDSGTYKEIVEKYWYFDKPAH